MQKLFRFQIIFVLFLSINSDIEINKLKQNSVIQLSLKTKDLQLVEMENDENNFKSRGNNQNIFQTKLLRL